MLRKYLVPVLLVVQVLVFLLLASVFIRQPAASASGAAAPQDRPQEQNPPPTASMSGAIQPSSYAVINSLHSLVPTLREK